MRGRTCVRACVCLCVYIYIRVCVCVCVYVWKMYSLSIKQPIFLKCTELSFYLLIKIFLFDSVFGDLDNDEIFSPNQY